MLGNHIPPKQGQSLIPGVCPEEGALKRRVSQCLLPLSRGTPSILFIRTLGYQSHPLS